MKIAYLLHWNDLPESGVWKKVLTQVRSWVEYGNEVSIFLITGSKHIYYAKTGSVNVEVFPYKRVQDRLVAWNRAISMILRRGIDIVYYRYDLFYPPLIRLLQRLPVVVEVNTNDKQEYCLNSRLKCVYNTITRAITYNWVSGIVTVSRELQTAVVSFGTNKKPICTIANGIDLSSYPILPSVRNKTPRLIFIGSEGQPWHGVDKVLLMARELKRWRFDIIGPARLPEATPNVIFHGFMPRKRYQELLAQADAAIGTLALHRKRMNEASPLKVREYLAFGLPVIIGYRDTDFEKPAPFLLELPNCEHNVRKHLPEIVEYVNAWQGSRVPRSNIQHLDVSTKEQERLAFFRRVIKIWEKNKK